MADDLDAEIRTLYAGEPSDFVKARDALARRLKSDGRTDEAASVKQLRKPERAAWALDRAAADDPDALAALVKAAAAAGTAQEGGGDVRAATASLREAVRRLAAAAPEPGTATADLVAVVADPDALDALASGRLSMVPEGGGFGPLPARSPEPAPERPTARDASAERREREAAKARKAADAALTRAQAARDKAAAAHDTAVRRREAAEEEERSAAERLAEAEAAVDAATAAVDELGD